MSKHHQSHRRRSYGRRQHEIHERPIEVRGSRPGELDDGLRDERGQGALRFDLDAAPNRMSYSVGD